MTDKKRATVRLSEEIRPDQAALRFNVSFGQLMYSSDVSIDENREYLSALADKMTQEIKENTIQNEPGMKANSQPTWLSRMAPSLSAFEFPSLTQRAKANSFTFD